MIFERKNENCGNIFFAIYYGKITLGKSKRIFRDNIKTDRGEVGIYGT